MDAEYKKTPTEKTKKEPVVLYNLYIDYFWGTSGFIGFSAIKPEVDIFRVQFHIFP